MPTLLIVEDERNIRRFVVANLVARGYRVLEAESAEDGLVQWQQHKPEALVLDIKLPGMNGWSMLNVVAGNPELPNIPVIILTASSLSDQPDDLSYTNIVEKLSKPVSVNDLLGAVKKALG